MFAGFWRPQSGAMQRPQSSPYQLDTGLPASLPDLLFDHQKLDNIT